MQICYGGSSACRSAQGRPECQAMLGRQRHDTASVHCTTPLDRSWVVRRVSTRQPPLHSHPCRCASSSGDSGESAADQRRRLEALFQAPSGESPADADLEAELDAIDDPAGQVMRDLPLWRVQWAALPGTQEVLHVHVPHYCDMFERIVAGPRPWHFGHLYLPGGSANLGLEAYALKPGSAAPLVGTLMEIVRVLRCPDGRLIVLAAGLGRIKVLRQQQDVPFSRADVEWLPDDEETNEWQPLIEHVLQAVDSEVSLLSVMQATSAAGHAAAVASAEVWQRYSIERHLALESPGEGVQDAALDPVELTRQVQRMELVEPLMPLPLEGRHAFSTASGWQERLGAVRVAAAEAAQQAATLAARSVIQSDQDELTPEGIVYSEKRINLNSTAQRGMMAQGSEAGIEDDAAALLKGDADDIHLTVRQLEALVWNELDAIATLAQRLQRGSPQLPAAFRSFRPAPTGLSPSAGGIGSTPAGQEASPFAVASSEGANEVPPGSPSAAEAAGDDEPSRHPPLNVDDTSAVGREQGSGEEDARLEPPEAYPGGGGHRDSSGAGYASRDYPPLYRAQRLSYALAMILHNISDAEGRQALLEAPSIERRFMLGLTALRKHRKVLAALASLKNLEDM